MAEIASDISRLPTSDRSKAEDFRIRVVAPIGQTSPDNPFQRVAVIRNGRVEAVAPVAPRR